MKSQDTLEERLQELNREAQSEYTQDPLGHALRYLYDVYRDWEQVGQGLGHADFMDGLNQAIHELEYLYIAHSSSHACDCRYPFPEGLSDDSWRCGECGSELVSADEPIVPDTPRRESGEDA